MNRENYIEIIKLFSICGENHSRIRNKKVLNSEKISAFHTHFLAMTPFGIIALFKNIWKVLKPEPLCKIVANIQYKHYQRNTNWLP